MNTSLRLAVVAALFTSGAFGCGEAHLTLNERMFKIEDGALKSQGSACIAIRLKTGPFSPLDGDREKSRSGTPEGDFGHSVATHGDVVVVIVTSQGATLMERLYNQAFLSKPELDEFSIRTRAGSEFLLRFWGGSCTPPDRDLP